MPSDDILQKTPPQSEEAERAALGSMLLQEDAVSQAIEILRADCFYKESHSKIFKAIIDLYSQNKPVDLVTVTEYFKSRKQLGAIGGASCLAALTQAVPTAANISHYAKIIKEKFILRSLIKTGTQIVEEAYQSEDNADALLDRAEAAVFDIATSRASSSAVSIKDIVKESIEAIDRLYQRKESVTGIATGFHDFDLLTAGLQSSDLIVIAGRPSMGKSAFACCIVEHAGVTAKIPTAVFSVEMSKEQLTQRMLCSLAKVNYHKVRTGFLSQSDWPNLTNAAGKLAESPIFIDDTPAISVLELRAKARRLKTQYNIGLIVVDYLQLMRGTGSIESRQQEISEISRALKSLARELRVPLIAISQLSRAVETRADKRPMLSDLRESGAIEQDADLVVLLLREEYYNPTPENKGIAEVIVAKQRNGPVDTIKLAFIKEYTKFDNMSHNPHMITEEEIEA